MFKLIVVRWACLTALMIQGLTAGTITSTVSAVGVDGNGDTVYRYVYDLQDFPLTLNEELDIRFAVDVFKTLSNGVAPAGFDLQLFQPNMPPGVDGDYSLLAMVDNPSMSGVFSVDVTLLPGATLQAQQYFVNRYDDDGTFLNTVSLGLTDVPEPSGFGFGVLGFMSVGLLGAARRSGR